MSVTAAISSIDTKELLKSPSGSVANALSGAVTGLSSIQPSGQPGAENPSIYIRGTGSLSDELSKPLILVDGVERSFFQMDSHEIESITVLKDAAPRLYSVCVERMVLCWSLRVAVYPENR